MFGGLFGFNNNDVICGGKHESYEEGLSDVINSKDIVSFSYNGADFNVSAKREDEKVHISATGGGKYNKRDGSYFKVRFDSFDMRYLDILQGIIERHNISSDNGHCVYVDGLPGGLGDSIEVNYSSGERIYKSNNQHPTISEDAIKEIYDVFHDITKKNGFDFNSEGSNVKLFDDADLEYVQGTWKGKHFGSEIEVTFKDKNVTIKVDDKVTDKDVEYIIVEGFIQKNKLKENATGTSHNDYEHFEGVSNFAKKNYFTMTGYFMKDSYSTCDLMNFDKEKPKDE